MKTPTDCILQSHWSTWGDKNPSYWLRIRLQRRVTWARKPLVFLLFCDDMTKRCCRIQSRFSVDITLTEMKSLTFFSPRTILNAHFWGLTPNRIPWALKILYIVRYRHNLHTYTHLKRIANLHENIPDSPLIKWTKQHMKHYSLSLDSSPLDPSSPNISCIAQKNIGLTAFHQLIIERIKKYYTMMRFLAERRHLSVIGVCLLLRFRYRHLGYWLQTQPVQL